jgi:serine/threonine protein kinase
MVDTSEVFCIPVLKGKKNTWKVKNTKNGEGVWETCKAEDCSYVMKIIPFRKKSAEEKFNRELTTQKHIADWGFTPKIEDSWIYSKPKIGVIIMKTLDMTALTFLRLESSIANKIKFVKTALNLLSDMHETGYFHGDFHLENIMLKRVNDISENLYVFHSSLGSYRVYVIGNAGLLKTSSEDYRTKTEESRMIYDYSVLKGELELNAPELFQDKEIRQKFERY